MAGLVVLEFCLKCLHFRLYGAHCGHGGELLLRNGEHQQSDNERQNDDSHAKIADIFKEPVEHEENGLFEPVEPTPIDRAIEQGYALILTTLEKHGFLGPDEQARILADCLYGSEIGRAHV